MRRSRNEPGGNDAFGIDPERGYAAERQPGAAGPTPAPGGGVDDWKRQALADFRLWLEELDEPPGAAQPDPDAASCDLRDLFAEFAALRQEVRLQNREQSRASRELADAAARCGEADRVLEARGEELAAFEIRVARAAENRCLRPVLDLRDALVRGRGAATRLRKAGSKAASKVGRRGKGGKRRCKRARKLVRRMQPGMAGVVEGYELAIRRCDRLLAQFGVRAVTAVGVRFDARTMHAVDTRRVKQRENGIVVEEYVGGFVRDGAVLRLAEVAVNRLRAAEEAD